MNMHRRRRGTHLGAWYVRGMEERKLLNVCLHGTTNLYIIMLSLNSTFNATFKLVVGLPVCDCHKTNQSYEGKDGHSTRHIHQGTTIVARIISTRYEA